MPMKAMMPALSQSFVAQQGPVMVFTEPSRSEILTRRYTFEHELGLWAFGTVQVLKERASGQMRTCKTTEKARLQGAGRALLTRLGHLKALRHAHLCGVVDILEDDANYYVISDRPSGGDIGEWMDRLNEDERHWLQEQTIASYVRQALVALAYCHSEGVYHRDLHPSNILLTSRMPDARVLIADMGLPSTLDPGDRMPLANPSAYHAPELRSKTGKVTGAGLDVWSVGAIAQLLLTGSPPSYDSGGWDLSPTRLFGTRESEAWGERSRVSRDFVEFALQPAALRPTAAQLLQHPWLFMNALPKEVNHRWGASMGTVAGLREKMFCYVLCALLVPAKVDPRDFHQLACSLAKADDDADKLVSRRVARALLQKHQVVSSREAPSDADIEAALDIIDVRGIGVMDLCSITCTAVLASVMRHLRGKEGKSASDVLPYTFQHFFEAYGQQGNKVVVAADLATRMYSSTGNLMERYAGVQYEQILEAFPEDALIDQQSLMYQLSSWPGRGTPLARSFVMPQGAKDTSPLDRSLRTFMDAFVQGCGMCTEPRDGPRFPFEAVET